MKGLCYVRAGQEDMHSLALFEQRTLESWFPEGAVGAREDGGGDGAGDDFSNEWA